MTKFHKLTIQKIIKETSDSVSILFSIPESLKDKFAFTAGQYINLKKEIKGEELRRAYSICSSPQSKQLKVAVKAVKNGKFSVFATTKLAKGDQLEVTVPEGRFTIHPKNAKNYIGFAAGSGITPIIAMIKSVLESSNSSFTLIYGNKSIADSIFYNELNTLQNKYAKRFKLHYVFSRERNSNSLFGRIDKTSVNRFIKNTYKGTSFDKAFLCGPEEMIKTVSDTLEENGIAKESIYFELFTTSSLSEENTKPAKDKQTKATIVLDDQQIVFDMKQSDNILAASLRNKIDAPYSCQGGVCSSCIALITHGSAIMTKKSVLSQEEVDQGYVLTCIAYPKTAEITVNYDEA
ncbi:MAG: 2Fe-2S iron-sulfur cluster-binding protein [Tenacibaculum sp.]